MSTLAKPTKLDPFAIPDLKDPVFQEKALVKYKDTRPSARERSNFSGEYSKAWIQDIRDIAKERNVNPYEILAWGMQEKRLGNAIHREGYTSDMKSGEHIFNLQYTPDKTKARYHDDNAADVYDKELKKYGARGANRRNVLRTVVDVLEDKERLANHIYKKRLGRPANRAEILQGIQGYGQSVYDRLGMKSFGKKGQVNWIDTPHGLSLLEHAKSLRNDPNISKILGK